MPLYEHESGERVRTVAGSPEDDRHAASDAWKPVDEAKRDAAPDTRTGRGSAVVNFAAGSDGA